MSDPNMHDSLRDSFFYAGAAGVTEMASRHHPSVVKIVATSRATRAVQPEISRVQLAYTEWNPISRAD